MDNKIISTRRDLHDFVGELFCPLLSILRPFSSKTFKNDFEQAKLEAKVENTLLFKEVFGEKQ